jgi:2-amino-4-hydroxy-6-hydroxymethyldihydropteridine diphosphokinase
LARSDCQAFCSGFFAKESFTMTGTAYVALGSNLGDRRQFLDQAVMLLRIHPDIQVARVSSYHETAPVGGPPGQGPYLNAALELQTDMSPELLLNTLLDVESKLGRERNEPYGPRTLDLDLLLYDQVVLDTLQVTVPHPRMHERLFVLEPLAEIAPLALHPVTGLTVEQLLHGLRTTKVRQPREASLPMEVTPPHNELRGLRAVVTGSTSGIGKAIALELAAGGADVIVHGKRSLTIAQLVADEIASLRVRGHALLGNLLDADECRVLAQRAWDQWDGLDIWVNNAGADTLTGEAASWPFERKLAGLLGVDVTGTIILARDVGERMKAQGHGVILNMGWDQAETGMEGDSGQLFATAKAAVMAFTKSLALTLAPQVRVNCLAPGWIRTAWGETAPESWQRRVLQETPLKRWGVPADVARAARWLVSPEAAFITGQVLRINGGSVR